MFRSILFASFITLFSTVTTAAQQPEVLVYLKDGSFLPGVIIKQSNLYIQLKDVSGNVHVLFPEDIKEIVKAPVQQRTSSEIQRTTPAVIPQGEPQLILLKDGTSVKGHIIAQDANELVVQSDLGKLVIPKEKIKTIQFQSVHNTSPQQNIPQQATIAAPILESVPRSNNPLSETQPSVVIKSVLYKNPGKAFLYSALLPGSGQYYNENMTKGTLFFISGILGYGALGAGIGGENDILILSSMAAILVVQVWSALDAAYSANRINTEIRMKNYGTQSSLYGPSNLALVSAQSQCGLSVAVVLRF